ncbi:hypothetical protein OQA88_1768 [Cercophora sp. LCS_1]
MSSDIPYLPPNSLILVTGANGLLASHVTHALLTHGYRVLGTVRTPQPWLANHFTTLHGPNRFSLVQVPDLSSPTAWDGILTPSSGIAGIASVAGYSNLFPSDVDAAVHADLQMHINLLAAAKRVPTIKAVQFTSSYWAASTPSTVTPETVTEESWNEAAVALAPDATDGLAKFMAVKTKVEQGVWEWIAQETPAYKFNTFLLDTVIGEVFDSDKQSGSTAGLVGAVYTGENLGFLELIAPQWFIDAGDVGRLYVGAFVTGVDGWRVFGAAEKFSWFKVLGILKGMFPEKKDWPDLKDGGLDLSAVVSERHLVLLRAVGREGHVGLEASVEEAIESLVRNKA